MVNYEVVADWHRRGRAGQEFPRNPRFFYLEWTADMPVRLAPNEELPPPLAGYTLVERLGRGGFGEVWRVEAPGGFAKAAKFVFGDLNQIDSEDARPAEQELKALKRMRDVRHPFIVTLDRVEAIDGQLILLMELADGNLWDRFRQCRNQKLTGIPRDELLGYLREVADALDYMNDVHRIQHLDVKPQNIFLMARHAKVADFGLAKYFEGDRGTMTGGVTPVYAAPETFESRVSRFTDQYSLAIVYQELLTGRRPFDGSNTRHLMNLHLTGVPDTSSLPPGDRPAVERALAKIPDQRWPRCIDLIRALERSEPVPPPSPPVPTRSSGDTPVPAWGPPSQSPFPASSPIASRTHLAGIASAARTVENLTAGYTGLPPRLVTPQGATGGVMVNRTRSAGLGVETGRMSALGLAPPEKSGPGTLMPALVIGVGGVGLAVLRALRAAVRDRFGSPDAVPTLRFLYIDTDPTAVAEAGQGDVSLSARDVLFARLHRPTHYLQHPILPLVETWLPPGLLYRLPKNPGPAGGIRAFGRLAICDHQRNLTGRVQDFLKDFLTDDILERAGRETGLGLRSNRVRVTVVAGLGGGTGSGMAVDLAYLLKHELRSTGYSKPECVGLLLAPPTDAAPQPAANSAACLTEIYHYSAGGRYAVRFEQGEAPITDSEGPFARTSILALPRAAKPGRVERVVDQAARSLFAELLTPAGRKTDEVRNAAPHPVVGPSVSVFGLHRLSWPRPELVTATGARFAERLLGRWGARDSAHLTEPVSVWMQTNWERLCLAPEAAHERLSSAVTAQLGEQAEAVFEAFVETLRTRTPGLGKIDAAAAASVLDQLMKLVGKPVGEDDSAGTIDATLAGVTAQMRANAEAGLSDAVVTFIERPQYRLAGADEALAQFGEQLRTACEDAEARRDSLGREVVDHYRRLLTIIGGLGQATGLAAIPGRKSALTAELFEELRSYPTARLAYAELAALTGLYQSLVGGIPEYRREVNDCRSRLASVARTLAPTSHSRRGAAQTLILPAGCDTLAAAADRALDAIPPEATLAFDQELQTEIRKRFKGLTNLCQNEARVAEFAELLAAKARVFVDAHTDQTDPAEALLRYRGPGPELEDLLKRVYDAAAPLTPGFTGEPPLEAAILAGPGGPAARKVRDAAILACPGDPFIPAPLPDDILMYRELLRVPLAQFGQLGPVGREIIAQQQAAGNTPHARADVTWVSPS